MYEDRETGEVRNGIERVSYTHDALIDMLIANPGMEQKELARRFGYSPAWISTIMASDSFQAAYERRREEIVDPVLRHSCEEGFKGLVLQSMQILRDKLQTNPSDQLALRVFENSTRAMGYGAKLKIEGEVRHSHSLVALLSSMPAGPVSRDVTPGADRLPETLGSSVSSKAVSSA